MRELSTATLRNKSLLSAQSQCFHLEFILTDLDALTFEPGQFLSCVADDARGKQQTRAYSIASAPQGNRFDFCVNRVDGGFFSNRLCDMQEGDTLDFHGPHGVFTLEAPAAHILLLAADTGVAPMRGFLQHLFPPSSPGERAGAPEHLGQITLVCAAACEADLYYRDEFERLAGQYANFRYIPTLADANPAWTGERGPLEQHAAALATALKNSGEENMRAYICGLSGPVKACRETLKGLGWDRKQIVSERYD